MLCYLRSRNADRAADRIEAYAKKADFEIVETIFKDTKVCGKT